MRWGILIESEDELFVGLEILQIMLYFIEQQHRFTSPVQPALMEFDVDIWDTWSPMHDLPKSTTNISFPTQATLISAVLSLRLTTVLLTRFPFGKSFLFSDTLHQLHQTHSMDWEAQPNFPVSSDSYKLHACPGTIRISTLRANLFLANLDNTRLPWYRPPTLKSWERLGWER